MSVYLSTEELGVVIGQFLSEGAFFAPHMQNDTGLTIQQALAHFYFELICKDYAFRTLSPRSIVISGLNNSAPIEVCSDGKYHYFVDAYQDSGSQTGCIVAARDPADLRDDTKLIFNDIVAAGIVDYRTGELCFGYQFGYRQYTFSGKPAAPYTEHVRKLPEPQIPNTKPRMYSKGSTAYDMMLVATKQAYACIGKGIAVGAGQLLVRGAGGVVVDQNGDKLLEQVYDAQADTPVVLAADQHIADLMVEWQHNPISI